MGAAVTVMLTAPKAIAQVLRYFEALGIERLAFEVPEGMQQEGPVCVGCSPDDRGEALERVRHEIGDCKRCGLCQERTNIVFGEGHPSAQLMFIGEGPGRDEDQQGRPFVGEAGKLLTRLIERMGLRRHDVYITNIVKCRPPENRDPEPQEIASCLPFLKQQIAIIQPRVIMSLGRIATHTLTGRKVPITRMRGTFYDMEATEFNTIRLMPTFHPSYLLRSKLDNEKRIADKKLVWSDAVQVLKALGREVPEQ